MRGSERDRQTVRQTDTQTDRGKEKEGIVDMESGRTGGKKRVGRA